MRYQSLLNPCKKPMTLGTAQFGMDYGITNSNGQVHLDDAIEIIRSAIAEGIEYIDTAAAYGNSEKVIGEALSEGWSSRVKIISKMSPFDDFLHKDNREIDWPLHVRDSVLASCINLNASSINTLMLHRADHLQNEFIMKELLELKKEDIIENIGVSIQNPIELENALNNYDVSIIQMPFNILDGRWDTMISRIQAIKKKRGLLIHARSSLLQGLLCSSNPDKWETANITNYERILNWLNHQYKQHEKVSVSDLCIGYVNSQDWIDSVVVGVDSKENLYLNLQSILMPSMSNKAILDLQLSRPNLGEDSLNPSNWKTRV